MKLFRCKISGDELLSDSFKIQVKEDFFYEVDGKNVKIGGGIDPSLIGANASAEEQEEQTEDSAVSVIDVVHNHNLQSVPYEKKDYQKHIKQYITALCKKIKEKDGDEAEADFKKRAAPAIKKVLENFKNWEFYCGEGMDTDGMVVLMDYREDGVTPYFWFIKDGFNEEKL